MMGMHVRKEFDDHVGTLKATQMRKRPIFSIFSLFSIGKITSFLSISDSVKGDHPFSISQSPGGSPLRGWAIQDLFQRRMINQINGLQVDNCRQWYRMIKGIGWLKKLNGKCSQLCPPSITAKYMRNSNN
eukprot:TRINITY_DN34457_c1_g1_i1.p1 TRINITY_DN34457_c1_g1~~TRINITY_DN34457_c1_g1_i1.p1  ORF type:complete len:130 (-),score=14.29 TRINITY_DN34457_c1_g1_i1:95-484(-)